MKVHAEASEGPPRLRRYLVAVRTDTAMATWRAVAGQEIGDTRRMYDAGLIEICQGRHGGHYQLYAIPRRTRSAERFYFSPDGRDIEVGGSWLRDGRRKA